jgi:hypothetical protein
MELKTIVLKTRLKDGSYGAHTLTCTKDAAFYCTSAIAVPEEVTEVAVQLIAPASFPIPLDDCNSLSVQGRITAMETVCRYDGASGQHVPMWTIKISKERS